MPSKTRRGIPKSTKLTRREMMVVELVVTEASQRLMAEELGIKRWTVQKHLDQIRNKIGCDTSVGIAMWYVRNVEYGTIPNSGAIHVNSGEKPA